jgi:CheY-like chemotaxis protein
MKNILLIDDDLEFSAAVCAVLRRAGYEVVHAANGRKGLVLYLKTRFDLVVSDILMPDVDGVEVILALRKLDAQLPIIAMSGGGLVQPQTYMKIARACGGNAFLTKPFDPAALIEQVTRAIGPVQVVPA